MAVGDKAVYIISFDLYYIALCQMHGLDLFTPPQSANVRSFRIR